MKTLLRLALVAAALGLAVPALAQTATATFQVTATVPNSCRIAASPIAFGNYDPLGGAAADASGGVTVTCTMSSAWWVGLNGGGNAGLGSAGARAMSAGGAFLGYDLYRDASRTLAWGNTLAAGSSGVGTGAAQPVTVFGRIPASQTGVPAGSYADTVTATVNF